MQVLLDLGTIRLIIAVENSFIINRSKKNPRLMFDISDSLSPHMTLTTQANLHLLPHQCNFRLS